MRFLQLACFIFSISIATAIWPTPQEIGHVTINLDLAPEDRYREAITNIYNTHGWEYSYEPVLEYFDEMLPPEVEQWMEKVSMHTEQYFGEEYSRELAGIAQVVKELGHGDDFPLELIVTLNLLYEWTTACTSIIAEDIKGSMWHGRNMDWSFGGYSLFNISAIADYQRNGRTVYSSIGWIGYVGMLSGVKSNFSVTVDQREKLEPDFVIGNMQAIDNGASSVGFLLRDAFAEDVDFSAALPHLAYEYLAAPVYYIMGGKNKDEGVVITRGRFANETDIWKFGTDMVEDQQPWYLPQTNYDHWQTDPKADPRRTEAINALNAVGQANLNADTLFSVLQTPGVLNSNTQYSLIINYDTSYTHAYGWQ